jgi:hypothetical protein
MNSYVFVQFDENITIPEYKIYKKKLIGALQPYFTCVLTKSFDPNLVGKNFSVHLSLGGTPTNQNKNFFYRYISYNSAFPEISRILDGLARVFSSFRIAENYLKSRTNVIVFDMDDTLIDKMTNPFYKNIFNDLLQYKQYFDYVILWTHGTTPYLSEVKLDFKFDLYMSRNNEESENKGLGAVLRELNKSHCVNSLDFCVLVDDGAFNFKDDYDLFLHVNTKPTPGSYERKLTEIVHCMNRYFQKKTFPRQINIE